MAKRKRDIQLKFRVTPQEREMIETKMAQFGTTNMAAYLRKMAIDGYVVKLDLPELRELVQRLENASSNAKVCCLILRDGQLTLALQTRYVFAGIPPELDMRDIDGIRRWFTASLTGMGGLLDILQELSLIHI